MLISLVTVLSVRCWLVGLPYFPKRAGSYTSMLQSEHLSLSFLPSQEHAVYRPGDKKCASSHKRSGGGGGPVARVGTRNVRLRGLHDYLEVDVVWAKDEVVVLWGDIELDAHVVSAAQALG